MRSPNSNPTSAATLSGTIERIVFRNAETHYTVARLLPSGPRSLFRNALITLVGTLPGITAGEQVDVEGEWETHPQHGRHLRVARFAAHMPVTANGLRHYLASGVIRGVGPRTAHRIIEHFGEQTLAVIELEPERLSEVRGLGPQTARRIAAGWAAQQEQRELMVFLQENGVSPGLAPRIFRQYGHESSSIIRENPYALERDIVGIGFRTADALAMQLGFPRDAQPRFMAGIKHVLSQAASTDGHCYLPRALLLERAAALLACAPGALDVALAALSEEGSVVMNGDDAYLAPFIRAEQGTARNLRRLLHARSALPRVDEAQWDALLRQFEDRQGIDLAAEQRVAVRRAYTSTVAVITGGPGVGKTTTLRALLDMLDQQGVAYVLGAPTGRAAKRMAEATGRPAATLHRLLEFVPGANTFGYNEQRPLPEQFVVVDEVSMLDILLAYRMVRAVRSGAHLLLVGDADQLPPVGPGSVLADVLASEEVPTARLTELFRQAQRSEIVITAHRINTGQLPERRHATDSDFFFLRAPSASSVCALVTDLVARRLPARYGLDPLRDIQVLAPVYRGPGGITALNAALQARLNPSLRAGEPAASGEQVPGGHGLHAGDKVMQVRNDYDKGVFNGDVGVVAEVSDDRRVVVRFADVESGYCVRYDPHELDALSLAYACSVHRAQGSEYPCVVLVLLRDQQPMLQRHLVYTAITRARQLCVVVGQWDALARAVRDDTRAHRFTALAGRLRGLVPAVPEEAAGAG